MQHEPTTTGGSRLARRQPHMDSGEHEVQGIIARAKCGDQRAWDALFKQYQPRLIVRFKRWPPDDAEDLACEVWKRVALGGLNRYQHRDGVRFISWLYAVAHNVEVNWFRKSNRAAASFHQLSTQGGEDALASLVDQGGSGSVGRTPDHQLADNRLRHQLDACIAQLPEHERTVFVERYLRCRSYKEVSEIVGEQEGTCRMRCQRARERLQHCLGAKGYTR